MANRSGGKYGLLAALLGDLVTVVVADSIHCGVAGFGISGNMSGMVLPDVTKAASRA
jgi:hypothetical protein